MLRAHSPAVFLLENVPNLSEMNGGTALALILRELSDACDAGSVVILVLPSRAAHSQRQSHPQLVLPPPPLVPFAMHMNRLPPRCLCALSHVVAALFVCRKEANGV